MLFPCSHGCITPIAGFPSAAGSTMPGMPAPVPHQAVPAPAPPHAPQKLSAPAPAPENHLVPALSPGIASPAARRFDPRLPGLDPIRRGTEPRQSSFRRKQIRSMSPARVSSPAEMLWSSDLFLRSRQPSVCFAQELHSAKLVFLKCLFMPHHDLQLCENLSEITQCRKFQVCRTKNPPVLLFGK